MIIYGNKLFLASSVSTAIKYKYNRTENMCFVTISTLIENLQNLNILIDFREFFCRSDMQKIIKVQKIFLK